MANAFSNVGAGALDGFNNTSVGTTPDGVPVNNNDVNANQWWDGDNVEGYLSGFSKAWNAIKGKPAGPETVVYQQAPPADPGKGGMSTGAVIGIVVGSIVLLIITALLVTRARRKS